MVHRLDRTVGRLVDRINTLGLNEKTLVIFTSDNGGHEEVWQRFDTNGPLRGYKRHLTEGGIRVLFIVRWPEWVPAGAVSSEIIVFQDMMPTFAELAGADCSENIDGISVLAVFRGDALTQQRPYLYWDYGHCRQRYDQDVRVGKWKGIRLGQNSKVQLYDLSEDLGETIDLAERHPLIVRQLEEIMRTAQVPSKRYPIGERYRGRPIWQKRHQ